MCVSAKSLQSCQLFVTPWTVAHQALLSMGFSRQEYWSGLPCPPPRDLTDPGIKHVSFMSPALAGWFPTTSAEIDVFLELSCFFNDSAVVGHLISGSSAFSKTSFNIWKFTVHVLLKPGLESFEHYFASV